MATKTRNSTSYPEKLEPGCTERKGNDYPNGRATMCAWGMMKKDQMVSGKRAIKL